MDSRTFGTQFEAEARRLRLNMYRLTGFVTGGRDAQDELLERMRSLQPGASWADVFPGIQLPDPPREVEDIVAAGDADPEVYWRERDVREALSKEISRVLSVELEQARSEGRGFGLPPDPRGAEHALRVLRTLPDAARWEACSKALAESVPNA